MKKIIIRIVSSDKEERLALEDIESQMKPGESVQVQIVKIWQIDCDPKGYAFTQRIND